MFTDLKMFSSSFVELGSLRARHSHDLVTHHFVQGLGAIGASLGETTEHLGRVAHREVGPTRIDALGREGQVEVTARLQARLLE